MAKGISLHIGVNRLDPTKYPLIQNSPDDPAGWVGTLTACEKDAKDMSQIAKENGFESTVLLTEDATSENVIKAMQHAAANLEAGDMFFLTYAGHGGQLPDHSGDERDGVDETWCLHDRQFLDDEQYALYSDFKEGVRVLILSDSCHSGTVSRGMPTPSQDAVLVDGRPEVGREVERGHLGAGAQVQVGPARMLRCDHRVSLAARPARRR